MKKALLLLLLCGVAHADEGTLSNGGMPKGFPATIQVKRVPLGSGVPSSGYTSGYDTAVAVGDGLYSVPGYLPYSPTGMTIYPRVITVACRAIGTWVCDGYSVTPDLGRGEYILIKPDFQGISAPQASK